MRVSFAALMAILLAAALNFSTPRPAQAACVVDVASWDVLWIRSGPSTRYQKVGSIPYNGCGVRVVWNDCSGNWYRVSYRGVWGWAHTRYLR